MPSLIRRRFDVDQIHDQSRRERQTDAGFAAGPMLYEVLTVFEAA
jgi:hypothetical protein